MAAEIFDGFGRPDGLIINGLKIVISPYLLTVPDSTNPFAKLPLGSFRSIEPVPPGSLTNGGVAGINWTLLTFDHALTTFSCDVVGPQKSGHIMVAYNANGQEIARTAIPYSDPSLVNTYHVSVTAPSQAAIWSIRLFVPANNDVYYTNLLFTVATTGVPGGPTNTPTPPVTTPTPPVVTPPVTPPTQSQILASYISLSEAEVDRVYVKNSLIPIVPESLIISNNAPNIDINVSIRGIAGVSVAPADFVLNRNTSQPLVVSFDTPTVNLLTDGVNLVDCAINLSVSSFTPLTGSITPPPTSSAPPPPSGVPVGSYLEERFHGSPGNHGHMSETAIFGQTPFLTKTVQTINYQNAINPIAAPTTVRWTGDFTIPAGSYTFRTTADDGMRVFLDGANILDAWTTAPTSNKSVGKTFATTDTHTIRVEYYNDTANCTAIFAFDKITDHPPVVIGPPGGGGGGNVHPPEPL